MAEHKYLARETLGYDPRKIWVVVAHQQRDPEDGKQKWWVVGTTHDPDVASLYVTKANHGKSYDDDTTVWLSYGEYQHGLFGY